MEENCHRQQLWENPGGKELLPQLVKVLLRSVQDLMLVHVPIKELPKRKREKVLREDKKSVDVLLLNQVTSPPVYSSSLNVLINNGGGISTGIEQNAAVLTAA